MIQISQGSKEYIDITVTKDEVSDSTASIKSLSVTIKNEDDSNPFGDLSGPDGGGDYCLHATGELGAKAILAATASVEFADGTVRVLEAIAEVEVSADESATEFLEFVFKTKSGDDSTSSDAPSDPTNEDAAVAPEAEAVTANVPVADVVAADAPVSVDAASGTPTEDVAPETTQEPTV